MKYDGTNLDAVLASHKEWVDTNGISGSRADFHRADLKDKDLSHAKLKLAIFSGANLANVDFSHAWLDGAYFRGANIRYADLQYASLFHADMYKADLSHAKMTNANLEYVDFTDAYMEDVCLYRANLANSIIDKAKMSWTFIPIACPDTGAFIGWKKCLTRDGYERIVKLLIPEDAKRSSASGRKCRCDKAIVLEIQDLDGNTVDENVHSVFQHHMVSTIWYSVGETVEPELPFDENRFNECASGIHFFINRQEAVEY